MTRFVLCAAVCLLILSVSAQEPVTWKTSPEDIHLSVKAGQPAQPLEFAWPLTESVASGRWLRVRCGSLQYLPVLTFQSIADSSGTLFEVEHKYSREAQRKNWSFFANNPFLAGWRTPRTLEKGQTLHFKGVFAAQRISGMSYFFRIETAESWDGPWYNVTPWAIVGVSGSSPEKLACVLHHDGRVTIQYTDGFGNPAAHDTPVTVTLKAPDGRVIDTITTDAAVTTVVPKSAPSPLLRVEVSDSNGLTAVSNVPMASTLDGSKVWYGDLHVHTEFSGDGVRPIPATLESARDELVHDFATCTDHMIFSNNYKTKDYFDLIDRYHVDGKFVTLLACEVSCPQGHVNLYFRNRAIADRIDPVVQAWVYGPDWLKANSLTFGPLFEGYQPGEILVVPHHTNTTSGSVVTPEGLPYWRNFDWRNIDQRYTPVAEIVQERGCFETESVDPDWRIIAGGYGSSLQSALARGLRLGFVGGSDNHFGWPSRNQTKPDFTALTGIYAKELTRQSLFEAIQNRRTFATSGVRIAVDFCLNNQYPMGSVVAQSPRVKRTFSVRVVGTDNLDRAEIVSQGAVLARLDCDGSRELNTTWTDPRPDAPIDNCYYYLRVHQTDGHCAWTSPIWIDYAP